MIKLYRRGRRWKGASRSGGSSVEVVRGALQLFWALEPNFSSQSLPKFQLKITFWCKIIFRSRQNQCQMRLSGHLNSLIDLFCKIFGKFNHFAYFYSLLEIDLYLTGHSHRQLITFIQIIKNPAQSELLFCSFHLRSNPFIYCTNFVGSWWLSRFAVIFVVPLLEIALLFVALSFWFGGFDFKTHPYLTECRTSSQGCLSFVTFFLPLPLSLPSLSLSTKIAYFRTLPSLIQIVHKDCVPITRSVQSVPWVSPKPVSKFYLWLVEPDAQTWDYAYFKSSPDHSILW